MRLSTRRLALAALLPLALAARPAAGPGALPPIVFVSRNPPPAAAGAIPGLGPGARTLAPGGRLLLRARDGTVRELLPPGALWDVSDPCIAPDGRRVAFAGTAAPESAWCIWVAALDRADLLAGLARVTRPAAIPGAAPKSRHPDDVDPCWVDDSTLCFASTRYPQLDQYGGDPVSNLFLMRLPDGEPIRITAERNGAEEPAMDFRRGRILFARWWHNRYMPADEPPGLTTDPARTSRADTVNLWHAMEVRPDGSDEQLACGAPATRLSAMAYQPAVLADGSIAAVYAANPGLSPRSGAAGIQRFAPRGAAGRRLAGAIAGDGGARAGYGSPGGLAPASACAPAGLPDGRVLFAYDPGGRGDFGLYVMRADGTELARVLDLPGTLELDPAPLVAGPRGLRVTALPRRRAPELPCTTLEQALRIPDTFRFLDLNVFESPADRALPAGPAPVPGARIRFYATLAREGTAGGDTVALVREAAVGLDGRVDESGLPAGLPMFEQIVDRDGHVLRGARGAALMVTHGVAHRVTHGAIPGSAPAAAHVAGLNAGSPGGTTRCIGCHVGHSTLLRRDLRGAAAR